MHLETAFFLFVSMMAGSMFAFALFQIESDNSPLESASGIFFLGIGGLSLWGCALIRFTLVARDASAVRPAVTVPFLVVGFALTLVWFIRFQRHWNRT